VARHQDEAFKKRELEDIERDRRHKSRFREELKV